MAKIYVKSIGTLVTKHGKYLKPVFSFEAATDECEWGVDPCYGFLRLPNFNSESGDETLYVMYIVDGVPVYSTVEDAIAAIKAFRSNTLVSATSSAIAGCLPEVDLVEAGTRQLTGSVVPAGALQTGTWLSSAPLIATVSGSGLVTAVLAGTTNITFTSTDGSFIATCVVTVVAGE